MPTAAEADRTRSGRDAACPSAPQRASTLGEGEIVLLKVRPSQWSILFSARWSLALLAAGAVTAHLVLAMDKLIEYRMAALQFLAGIAVLRLAWAGYLWATRWYVLTNRRVMWLAGGLRPLEFVALLTQIRQVRLAATFGQRLVGLATLVMPTRRKDELTICWHHLRHAEQIGGRVQKAIDAAGNNHAAK
jgi:hypothetical protein